MIFHYISSFLLFFFSFLFKFLFLNLWYYKCSRSLALLYFFCGFSYLCRFCSGQIEQPEIVFCLSLSSFSDFSQHSWSFHLNRFLSFKSQNVQKHFNCFWNQIYLFIFENILFMIFPFFSIHNELNVHMCVLLCYFKAAFYKILNHYERWN